MKHHISRLWISLVEAEALPEREYAGEGAYVYGLAFADSARRAEESLGHALLPLGWKMVGAAETEPFAGRCRQGDVAEDLKRLARLAMRTRRPQLGTFYSWAGEEEAAEEAE